MRQSPIDIFVDRDVYHRPDGVCPFVFYGYNTKPIKFEILNTGNTIQFTKHLEEEDTHPYITGGGLPKNEEFEFVQGHFHWNNLDEPGAEHHVDNYPDRAPLELHLVHMNKAKGSSLVEAINTNDWNSLAVLAIKYDIGDNDNEDLAPLFNALKEDAIHEKWKYVTLKKNLKLKSFLPRGTGRFYRYNGSLTTPRCNEVVIWTVFKDRELISKNQIQILRDTMKGSMKQPNNTRPVQPLNGRIVLDIDTRDYDGSCSSSCQASTCPDHPPIKDCSSIENNFRLQQNLISSLLELIKMLICTISNSC